MSYKKNEILEVECNVEITGIHKEINENFDQAGMKWEWINAQLCEQIVSESVIMGRNTKIQIEDVEETLVQTKKRKSDSKRK